MFFSQMSIVQWFVGAVIAGAMLLTGYWYFFDTNITDDPVAQNWGLDEPALATTPDSGWLTFYGDMVFEDTTISGFYQYDLVSEQLSLEPDLDVPLNPSLARLFSQYGYFLEVDEAFADTASVVHPARIDVLTTEVTRLPVPSLWLETMVAVQPTTVPGMMPSITYAATEGVFEFTSDTTIEDWQVVIFNANTEEVVSIDGAVSPVWFNEGRAILYAKSDGVYRYTLASGISEQVIAGWTDLPASTQLAVAPDSSAVVVAFPPTGQLVVFRTLDSDAGEFVEVGVIGELDTYYFDPVFSPTSNQYAVQKQVVDANGNIDTSVVIREVFAREPLAIIRAGLTELPVRSLVNWRGINSPTHFTPLAN